MAKRGRRCVHDQHSVIGARRPEQMRPRMVVLPLPDHDDATQAFPDVAEPALGLAEGKTRGLHPGYEQRA